MKDNLSAFNTEEYDYKIKQTLPYYEAFYSQVVEAVKCLEMKNPAWLDIGCGTGKMAEIALQSFKCSNFTFQDISAKMLAVAKQRFTEPFANFLLGSVKELNCSEEFDVVTAIQVNHYASQSERITAIKNCYDALKNGGVFFNFENFAPFSEAGKELYLKRWASYQMQHGKSEAESQSHVSRYGKAYFPITISEHLQAMEMCGFKQVEILWVSYMQVGVMGMK